jgi:hypothetical protein
MKKGAEIKVPRHQDLPIRNYERGPPPKKQFSDPVLHRTQKSLKVATFSQVTKSNPWQVKSIRVSKS